MDGLHTALPFGPRKINALRTLTTESTAVLIPFHTQEIMQEGGIYYGQNAVSKKYDRCGPEETAEWQQFSLRSQWIRKKFFCQRRDCCISTCHGG